MDRSLSTKRPRVTPPIPRIELVKLPTGRELEIKFKTDAAGLKLAHGSELLSTDAADAPRRTLRSVYFDTPAGDLRKQRMVLRVHVASLRYAITVTRNTQGGARVERLLPDQMSPFDRDALCAQTQRADRMKPITSCLACWRSPVQPA
jgi:hypothetical protein